MIHIELDDVGYRWSGGAEALRGVSFQVERGEFCAVVGASGCGKSTLLRMLAGLATPTQGRMTVHRENLERPSTTVVFQEHGVFPWMRVRANVAYALEMRGVPRATRDAAVDSWLRKTGLETHADAWPRQLSGGMRQRVAVARAMANDPELLLMDEPFGALDEQTRAQLQMALMRTWTEARRTVVFVTHSLSEAVILADRVVVLGGRPGTVKEIVAVPLPRPRDPYGLRAVAAFGELVAHLWSRLTP